MYQSAPKKSSSWTVTSIQKKSKNFSKPGSSAVQPKREALSDSQDTSYSTIKTDLLTANIMRSLETQELESSDTTTVQRQSSSGEAALTLVAPPIVSTPVVQSNAVGIQRPCNECASEQQEKSGEEGKDVLEMSFASSGIQTKLTVGTPGDVYEQEADRMAQQVMSMPTTAAAPRQVQPFGEEPSPVGMYSSLAQSITPVVHRQVDEQVQMYSRAQRAFQAGGNEASGDLESRLNASKGGGNALAPEVRAFMEPRFGADFSSVRVHTGSEAVQMNRELGAQAFAHGSDVYFGAGKSPGNNELTAHELTHVVQQNSASDSIQRALKSPRFSETPELESAHDDKKHLKKGSTGLSVRILQQALLDAGYPLPRYGVDGIFGGETETAVKAFQKAHGLKNDGIVGPETMQALDTSFLDHGAMASIPQSEIPSTAPTEGVEWDSAAIPPELLEGTRTLTAEEKAEIERRRTTEVQAPKGGTLPVFQMKIPTHSDSYEKRVEEKTNQTIDRQYNRLAKGKAADRKDPDKLYKWDVIEKVAAISKKETDRVFGNYAKGKPFKAGLNLFDAWEEKEKQFAAGGAAYDQGAVKWRVEKIFGGDLGEIDKEHGAVQSRTTEKGILDTVKHRIIANRKSELIEIHKGWPGFADEGKVYLQRFVSSDAAKNRDAMWKNFQTVVHEYIHTLEHSKHQAYRAGLRELKGGKTYREGMTEYFTKIVLESTTYDDKLREDVEGHYHDPTTKHPIPKYFGYKEAKNAEAVVGVVGIRNAMAAFFTGRIDLIGG